MACGPRKGVVSAVRWLRGTQAEQFLQRRVAWPWGKAGAACAKQRVNLKTGPGAGGQESGLDWGISGALRFQRPTGRILILLHIFVDQRCICACALCCRPMMRQCVWWPFVARHSVRAAARRWAAGVHHDEMYVSEIILALGGRETECGSHVA
jgi:hypothetical protein